mmetsp:Transcript_12396/g.51906  ORF Transcript_12396/g.51906 Transcript_12396/m.51906 type:complete len:307 (+) Transcript_12396:535-1455(+)
MEYKIDHFRLAQPTILVDHDYFKPFSFGGGCTFRREIDDPERPGYTKEEKITRYSISQFEQKIDFMKKNIDKGERLLKLKNEEGFLGCEGMGKLSLYPKPEPINEAPRLDIDDKGNIKGLHVVCGPDTLRRRQQTRARRSAEALGEVAVNLRFRKKKDDANPSAVDLGDLPNEVLIHINKLAAGSPQDWYHEPDYISKEDLPFFVKDKSCCSYQVESGRRDDPETETRGVDLLNFDTVQKNVSLLKSKVSSSKSITDKHYSYERLLNRRAEEGWQLFSVVSLNSQYDGRVANDVDLVLTFQRPKLR